MIDLYQYKELLKESFETSVRTSLIEFKNGKVNSDSKDETFLNYILNEAIDKILNVKVSKISEMKADDFSSVLSFIVCNEKVKHEDIEEVKQQLKTFLEENLFSLSYTLMKINESKITISKEDITKLFYKNVAKSYIFESKREISPLLKKIFESNKEDVSELVSQINSLPLSATLYNIMMNEGFEVEDNTFITKAIESVRNYPDWLKGIRLYLLMVIGDWVRFNEDTKIKGQTEIFSSKETFVSTIKKNVEDKMKKIRVKYSVEKSNLESYLSSKQRYYYAYTKEVEVDIKFNELQSHLKKIVEIENTRYDSSVPEEKKTESITLLKMGEIQKIASTIQRFNGLKKFETSLSTISLIEALSIAFESVIAFYTELIAGRIRISSYGKKISLESLLSIVFIHVSRKLLPFEALFNDIFMSILELYSLAQDQYDLNFFDYDEIMNWKHSIDSSKHGDENLTTNDYGSLMDMSKTYIKKGVQTSSLSSIGKKILQLKLDIKTQKMSSKDMLKKMQEIDELEKKYAEKMEFKEGKDLAEIQRDIDDFEVFIASLEALKQNYRSAYNVALNPYEEIFNIVKNRIMKSDKRTQEEKVKLINQLREKFSKRKAILRNIFDASQIDKEIDGYKAKQYVLKMKKNELYKQSPDNTPQTNNKPSETSDEKTNVAKVNNTTNDEKTNVIKKPVQPNNEPTNPGFKR